MLIDLGSWKSLALRGAAALLFGILTLAWPAITLFALVLLFGAFVLVDGVFLLMSAFRRDRRTEVRRGLPILQAVVGIAIGVVTFVWPSITALALLYLMAAWAILTGGLEIASAVRLRKLIDNEWLLGLAGALSVVFGVILVLAPGAGALAIAWLIGVYAAVVGMIIVALAFKIRRLFEPLKSTSAPLSA